MQYKWKMRNLCALGSFCLFLFSLLLIPSLSCNSKGKEEKEEKEAAKNLLTALEDALETGDLSKTDFPDTPIGRMAKIVSELIRGMLNTQKEFEEKIYKLDLDWMFSDEALSSKENLKECLRRTDLFLDYAKDSQVKTNQLIDNSLKELEKQSTQSKEAKEFYLGFKSSFFDPVEGSKATFDESNKLIINYHLSLKEYFSFLLNNHGNYTVKEGEVTFNPNVKSYIKNEFERISNNLFDTTDALIEFEERQYERARQKIDEAKKIIK